MKSPLKALLLSAAIATTIVLLAWAGGILYWHFKITGAIRSLETEGGSTGDFNLEPVRVLRYEAGCRALPYLVSSLDPTLNPLFLARATTLIAIEVDEPGRKGDRWSPSISEGKFEWCITLDDSIEQRRKKCEAVREFWKAHGRSHHQTWKVWTRACVPNN